MGGSEGFIATSPNGIKYHFDKLNYRSATGILKDYKVMGRKRAQMFATKVEDRFGNYVEYDYSTGRLTSITASDGRTITIIYGTNGNISSITANGRTWTYGYTPQTGYNWEFLTSVTLPTTSPIPAQSWSINLASLILAQTYPGLYLQCGATRTTATGTVTHPYGTTGTYTIRETAHGRTDVPQQANVNSPNCTESVHIQRSFDVLSLTQKKLEGKGIPTMVWDYSYSENQGGWAGDGTNPLKTTRVDKPDNSYDIHHFDRSWSYLEGAAKKVQSYSSTGTLLQTVDYDHIAGPGRGVFGQMFYENLAKSSTPKHRVEVKTTRGTDVYTTEYEFGIDETVSTFSFGNPIQVDQDNNIVQQDEFGVTYQNSQIVDITYAHDLTNWELARETTRKVGTETISENVYNNDNRVEFVKKYGVEVQQFDYNTDGTIAWQEDALDNRITFANWYRGIPELITYPDSTTHAFDVDDNGWITSSEDAKFQTTLYEYDKQGRMTLVDYPDEPGSTRLNKVLELDEVTVTNDGLSGSGIEIGQWKHVKTRGDLTITTYLDSLFRPVLTRRQDTTDSTLDRFSTTTYDSNSQPTFSSFSSGSLPITAGTDTVYDALQRVIEVEETVTPFAKTTYAYQNGNKTLITNPRSKQTTTTYFALGSPDQSAPTLITQPESVTTTIVRNSFGEMTSATQSGTGPTVSATRSYYYDSSHRLCRQVDPETGSTAYDYNDNNQIVWYALAASGSTSSCDTGNVLATEKVQHTYDNMGRIGTVNYPDASPDLTYDYDDNGNLWKLNSSSANWTYDYNKVDALKSETLVTNSQTFALAYGFDTMDRLTSTTYPSSQVVTIYPNAYGEPEEVVNYADTIKYHPNGSIKTFNYENGRTYETIQNVRQLPKDLIIMDGSTVIADLEHSYDANANIITITDAVTTTSNRAMTYDDIDRLKSASGIWGSGTYSYDALGNILTKNEGSDTISITYDASNLVDDVTINSSARQYVHDAYGNVTGNGVQTFTYNLAGNMVTSSGPSITNYYDGHKRRIRQLEGSDNTYTVYGQGGTLLHKEDGGVETDYIYAGSLLVAKKAGTNIHYLHTDLLGSPIDGKVGTTNYTENYKPWGEKLDNPVQLADDIGYTGHQSDVETGLSYMQARYYDPVVGRFMAVDPVGFTADNPMSFNRYLYANDNPFRYVDPDGNAAVTFEVSLETKLGGAVVWAANKFAGADFVAGGGHASVGVSVSFPAFDGGKFDAGIVAAGGASGIIAEGGNPLPSLPGGKLGASLAVSKGSVSDLAGRSYDVQAQTNIGKAASRKVANALTSAMPGKTSQAISNYATKGLSAILGVTVSAAADFNEDGQLAGFKIGAAKGANLGLSADSNNAIVCSIRDGCNK